MGDVEANRDIWVLGVDRPTRTRVTRAEGDEYRPSWHPDGDRIVHTAGRGRLQISEPSGTGVPRPLERMGDQPSWSHNGQFLVFSTTNNESRDLAYARFEPDGLGPTELLLATPADEKSPRFAPGGGLVAYVSDASGRPEVYLCAFPEPGSPIPVSVTGGEFPQWNAEGDELFYVGYEDDQPVLMAVAVHVDGGKVTVEAPQKLFEGLAVGSILMNQYGNSLYAPSGDGQRFLIVRRPVEGTPTVNAMQNWSQARDQR